MGKLLHGRSTTTLEIRKAIQDSQESILKLDKKYGINHQTVIKWRKREDTQDRKTGHKNPSSTVLT